MRLPRSSRVVGIAISQSAAALADGRAAVAVSPPTTAFVIHASFDAHRLIVRWP
jgi:hypothetical protein